MRVDNDGEGGILALMALLGVKRERPPVIVAVGLFGAALIYGDGAGSCSVMITVQQPGHRPAIRSSLSLAGQDLRPEGHRSIIRPTRSS
jgi:hypothetical protein